MYSTQKKNLNRKMKSKEYFDIVLAFYILPIIYDVY